MIDLLVATAPAMAVLWLPFVWVPMDRGASWLMLPGFGLALAAMVYLYLGCALLRNTSGRRLMGIRVVDRATGGRPNKGQALQRSLTVGLWPVEAALVLFSRTGRRLGDRWADTEVVREAAVPTAPAWKRLAPLGGALAAAGLVMASTPWVISRMDVVATATAYARQTFFAEPLGTPGYVEVVRDSGNVALRLTGNRHVRVFLARDGQTWRALRSERIEAGEMGGGFSIQTSGGAARNPDDG